ncbi:hypothetical protein NC652_015194 [Populus alba x Populus x berolinensis]|nr:hypothetical protein NC652_015194 [Populus alba x Populus x berolinensis]
MKLKALNHSWYERVCLISSLKGLSSLKSLDIAYNQLKGSFNVTELSSLKGLSSLKFLGIAYNQLKGSFNVTELDALINLEVVDLEGNKIDKFVLSKDTRGFGNVSFISLSNNTSNGRALPFTLLAIIERNSQTLGPFLWLGIILKEVSEQH